MRTFLNHLNDSQEGIVVSTSRRWTYFLNKDGDSLTGTAATSSLDITVGDKVLFEKDKSDYKVLSVQERTNFLTRQYGKQVKRIAANLDRLYIITAPGALLNTAFIDRICCAAYEQDIPCTLVVNKIDLEQDDESKRIIAMYQQVGMSVIFTSAKTFNIQELVDALAADQDDYLVSFAGVSGVGKSSLLNAIIPEAERDTGDVSVKTGQGKQTTSQSRAYRYTTDEKEMLVIDLPGIQHFGITHLDAGDVIVAMPDLLHFCSECEYDDCSHRAELTCGVKAAVERGEIAQSRYESYLTMVDEIVAAREY